MVWTGPDTFMTADEEIRENAATLESAMEESRTEDLLPDGVAEVRELVMTSRFQAIRRALSGTRRRTWNHCRCTYSRTRMLLERGRA